MRYSSIVDTEHQEHVDIKQWASCKKPYTNEFSLITKEILSQHLVEGGVLRDRRYIFFFKHLSTVYVFIVCFILTLCDSEFSDPSHSIPCICVIVWCPGCRNLHHPCKMSHLILMHVQHQFNQSENKIECKLLQHNSQLLLQQLL